MEFLSKMSKNLLYKFLLHLIYLNFKKFELLLKKYFYDNFKIYLFIKT